MKLRYQTGVAALIQFISMVFLNFVGLVTGSAQSCTDGSGCIGGILINLIYFLLISAWFAFLWVLGYAAQDRRSKRMAQVLILAEGLVVLVSLFDARHYPGVLGLFTSVVDCALAVWVILLAVRLMRAEGGRIVRNKAGAHERRAVSDKIKK